MGDWRAVLTQPAALRGSDTLTEWFVQIAARLMNGRRLIVAGEPYRIVEVEFYYHSAGHPDVFAHRDPIQVECGRWYFHKTRGVYRGGSFKGIDLTFGNGRDHGGILVRGIETPEDQLIDGPSLCVDYLRARTGHADVAALDRTIAGRPVWDSSGPVTLAPLDDAEPPPLLRTPRVGLSLKRLRPAEGPTRYLMRSYRCLSEPRRTAKGKVHMVLALHARGHGADEINQRTGCPRGTVHRYVADFEEGRRAADFAPYFGIDLGPKELCRLYGVWWAHYGGTDGKSARTN